MWYDHFPNAVHIRRVIASDRANLSVWERVSDDIHATGDRTFLYMEPCIRSIGEHWRDVINAAATDAAHTAILALIAYDQCEYMLDAEPDDITMLALLGDTCACLILPACKAFFELR